MTAISEERREFLREIGRKGGKARAQMPDFQEHQRHAGRCSAKKNDMAALGHKGAVAYIRKYGYAPLFHLARSWRLENPSSHECQMMAILDEQGVTYEREAEILGENAYVSVDFYLPDTKQVIEVNGKIHYDPLFDHPNYPNTRKAKDQERLRKLEKAGFQILVIDHRDLKNQPAVRKCIEQFLREE